MLVGLVDDHEINVGVPAPGQRLSRANLDRLLAVRQGMAALHDADGSDALSAERGDGLVDQGEARHAERDTLAPVQRAANDVGSRQRLAETGGSLEHRTPMT